MSNEDDPVEYTGLTGAMRDSIWLTNEDIPHDKDTIVTIEKINLRRAYKFKGSKSAKDTYSLVFRGAKRELRVNAGHRRTLNNLLGVKTGPASAWKGMTIALFVEQDVGRPDGSSGPAVRIRSKRIQPQQAAGSTKSSPGSKDTPTTEIVDPGASQSPQEPSESPNES